MPDVQGDTAVRADDRRSPGGLSMQIIRLVLIACVLTAGCGASGPSPATGLTGTVVRGPITPVCRIDVPCDGPFAAGAQSKAVTVGDRGLTTVRLTFDTGIR